MSNTINDRAEMAAFENWTYGKEADATYGAAARFIQSHAHHRPATEATARFESLDAMLCFARFNGPDVTQDQLTAAITAFRDA